jgi:hypothetical protein
VNNTLYVVECREIMFNDTAMHISYIWNDGSWHYEGGKEANDDDMVEDGCATYIWKSGGELWLTREEAEAFYSSNDYGEMDVDWCIRPVNAKGELSKIVSEIGMGSK